MVMQWAQLRDGLARIYYLCRGCCVVAGLLSLSQAVWTGGGVFLLGDGEVARL